MSTHDPHQVVASPTWYNYVQNLFTAAAGRPNSIGCMQQSTYGIDLTSYDTFTGPDPTPYNLPTCGLAILKAVSDPGNLPIMPPPGSGDRAFSRSEIATYSAWCKANYPMGTPPGQAAKAEGGGHHK
jgi:hypothetical protein